MNPKQVIDFFGSCANAAKALGISRQSVWYWGKTDFVPAIMQHKIERLTGGVLKIDDNSVTINDIVKLFGTFEVAAYELGFDYRTLKNWQRKNTVPLYLQRIILARMETWKKERK